MGLIARQAEAAGIPTLSMSCARDITAAVNPPRATYLDWPLGHTSGRPGRAALNESVMRATLAAFERIAEPGTIVDLGLPWADDDDWKDRVMRARPEAEGGAGADGPAADDRVARHATPQYQDDADAAEAAARHGAADCTVRLGAADCTVCRGIDY